MSFPSFAAFCWTFDRPVMTTDVSMPDFSRFPSRTAESAALRFSSRSAEPFVTRLSASFVTLMPVSCPTLLSMSRTAPASFVSRPKADIIFCTLSIEELTSVPFSSANLMKCALRSSSSWPVTPKRVLTSPMAAPAVSNEIGMLVAMFSMRFCMSSSCSPVAPVFVIIVSSPLSTSLAAAIDAAPTAMIGAVTFLDSVSPTLDTSSPSFLTFLPASSIDAPKIWNPFLSTDFSLLSRFASSASAWTSASFHLSDAVLFSPVFLTDSSYIIDS